MSRYAKIVLALAVGFVAVVLALPGLAGLGCDEIDIDGVCEFSDNCMMIPNGPLLATGSCNTQLDGDQDGYGNPCDTDVNNDGATALTDVSPTLAAAKTVSTNPIYDFNCDGATGLSDVSKVLSDSKIVRTPGPSGLACAGTAPCP